MHAKRMLEREDKFSKVHNTLDIAILSFHRVCTKLKTDFNIDVIAKGETK